MTDSDWAPARGFAPIERGDALALVLGSLPGRRSLDEAEYYAHPRNAFWPIMKALFGIDGDYVHRCRGLTDCRIAVWDVLAESVRPGSLDADIRMATAVPNDLVGFVAGHPDLRLVLCNGRKSGSLLKRYASLPAELSIIGLPSTSPAYATMPFSGKLAAWRRAFMTFQDDGANYPFREMAKDLT